MVIPLELRAELDEPAFWARYLFAHEDGPGADRLGDLIDELDDDFDEDEDYEIEVRFDAGGGHRLSLSLDPSLDSYELGILGPGEDEPAELGWDDLAHWHPFAFRWAELELICRAIAVADPSPKQGSALALLCRFAAVFEDDDVAGAVAAVDAAFASLRPAGWTGYWPAGADWLSRADLRGQGVQWHSDVAGNRWGVQSGRPTRDFYSTRSGPPGESRFPHERLRALLDAAAGTVAA
ncbi:hypothetical protein [Actinoplanes sp. G11-F43]|uniref:hypothetical protein n=1 Tax=Actinoplanes sp. G11-F43 TaxID=3424130 RepID=UPI003D3255D3